MKEQTCALGPRVEFRCRGGVHLRQTWDCWVFLLATDGLEAGVSIKIDSSVCGICECWC